MKTSRPSARAAWRLALGLAAIAALGFTLSQSARLPGAAGEVIRANVGSDRDAAALFYPEVAGWRTWRARP